MKMRDSEVERANTLYRQLRKEGIEIEQLLEPGYEAIVLHSNSTIITANEAAARLTGYSIAEMKGLNAWTLFPPQSIKTLMEKLTDATEEPYHVLAKRRDGRIVHVEIKGINFQIHEEPVRAVLLKQISH